MGEPQYDFRDDHLHIRLDRVATLASFTGSVIVPYSTITDADVIRPEIPGIFDQWLHGLHVPNRVAKGRFVGWKGKRRFLWFDAKAESALRLTLAGHPAYDEILVAVPDPAAALARVQMARRRGGAVHGHGQE